MCNAPIPFKIFTIEIYPNGKTVLPAFITPDGMHLSISELKQCRELIDLIIDNPNYFHVVKPDVLPEVAIPKSCLPGPVCKKCSKDLTWESLTERQNLLCFDCERKQIIKSPDNFNRVSCIVCEGEFDNPLQKQLGICGKCMKEQSKANKRDVGNYVDKLKSALTPEQKELIDGYPKQVVDVSLIEEMSPVEAYAAENAACVAHGICTHKRCVNNSEKGATKCFLHINKDVDGFQILSQSEINSINNACKDTDEKPVDLNLPKPKLRTITPTDITKPGC